MNRVQAAFIAILAAIVLADLALAAALAAIQGTAFVATARIVMGMTGILLLAAGLLMAGSSRAYPVEGSSMNSPVLLTPRFQAAVLRDREAHAVTVSDYPAVGALFGVVLCAVALLLTFIPGA